MRDTDSPDLFGPTDIAMARDLLAMPPLRWALAVAAGVVRALPAERSQCLDVLGHLECSQPAAAKALRLARLLLRLKAVRHDDLAD